MFPITAKVKIAASVAAGALALGGAGAYAATANNTITVESPATLTLPNGGPTLIAVDKNAPTTLPSSFANQGECVSFFAKNRDFALAPQGSLTGSVKVSKNYHGKLLSGLHDWCKSQVTSTTKKSGSAESEAPEAAETDSDTADAATNGASHGHGHAYGHGKHVAD
jgi:hypothetical protein